MNSSELGTFTLSKEMQSRGQTNFIRWVNLFKPFHTNNLKCRTFLQLRNIFYVIPTLIHQYFCALKCISIISKPSNEKRKKLHLKVAVSIVMLLTSVNFETSYPGFQWHSYVSIPDHVTNLFTQQSFIFLKINTQNIFFSKAYSILVS